ncbi:hypothetical protein GILI108418_13290 [Gillisia limnaea]|uniref:Uncharacterized protein n=1 Tax=Gillisia limnaea (strain DSM 15749 / LMG 21470 / R-8282) TaxID=865937 RepID=H2BY13_GILLR|nr:hypothetical protein Gilli_2601 [Gillisia limnaea DSM 15749]
MNNNSLSKGRLSSYPYFRVEKMEQLKKGLQSQDSLSTKGNLFLF